MKNNPKIDEAAMLEEIRKLLGLTIEEFVFQMDWPNTKYYSYIKNGRRDSKHGLKVYSHPTISKVFNGINHAINQYPHWKAQSSSITAIVISFLLPSA